MLYDFFASSPSPCSSLLDSWPHFNFDFGDKSLPFTKAFEEKEMNSWCLTYATQAHRDLFRSPETFQEHEYHRSIATKSSRLAPEGDESVLGTFLDSLEGQFEYAHEREPPEDVDIPPTPATPRLEMMRDASCSTLPSMNQFQILQSWSGGMEAKNESYLQDMKKDQPVNTSHISKLRDNVEAILSVLDPAIDAINEGSCGCNCNCAADLQQLRLEMNRLTSQDHLRNSLIQILQSRDNNDRVNVEDGRADEVGGEDKDEDEDSEEDAEKSEGKEEDNNEVSPTDDRPGLEAIYPLAPKPPTLIHQHASVPPLASISGLGVSICPDATIAETAYVKSHATIATGATIEGGAIIKAHAFISEGATVQVAAVVESGAVVAEGMVVPMGKTIRAGAVFRGMDGEGDEEAGGEGLGPYKKVEEWMVEMRDWE